MDVGIKTGIKVRYEDPKAVGADRIADAVAVMYLYGGPACVIDFGTATTFNALTKEGEYLGGAITAGINLATEALFVNAAKLPRIDLQRPPSVIGRNTVHAMQAGLLFGYVSMVEGMVERFRKELGSGNEGHCNRGAFSNRRAGNGRDPDHRTVAHAGGAAHYLGFKSSVIDNQCCCEPPCAERSSATKTKRRQTNPILRSNIANFLGDCFLTRCSAIVRNASSALDTPAKLAELASLEREAPPRNDEKDLFCWISGVTLFLLGCGGLRLVAAPTPAPVMEPTSTTSPLPSPTQPATVHPD